MINKIYDNMPTKVMQKCNTIVFSHKLMEICSIYRVKMIDIPLFIINN